MLDFSKAIIPLYVGKIGSSSCLINLIKGRTVTMILDGTLAIISVVFVQSFLEDVHKKKGMAPLQSRDWTVQCSLIIQAVHIYGLENNSFTQKIKLIG